MGASIAFHLARRGVGKIMMLEKRFVGAGSTGKSGAIIRQHYSHPLTTAMARQGLRFFEQFSERVGATQVFTRAGMAIVVARADRERLEANVAMQRQVGVDVRIVSADELREIDPDTRVDPDEVAAYEREAGYVEAVSALGALVDAARRDAAELRERVEVTAIRMSDSAVTGVETTDGTIESKTVVIAAGPWASRVAATAGVDLPVNACRTQVALFRRPAESTGHLSVYGDFAGAVYFKPTWGDLVHVGSISSEEADAIVDPDSYREAPDETFLKDCRAALVRRVPAMARAPGRGGYAALYSITPDWHPILDRLAGIDGLYCAVGFSGHGFKLSPAVGELMSELIVDGSATTHDIAPLRFSRFEEKKPFLSPSAYGVMG